MTVIIYYVFDPGLGIAFHVLTRKSFLIPIISWSQDHVKLKLFHLKLHGGAYMGWNLLF